MKDRDDYKIQLYRGPDRKFFGTKPFMPILRESLEKLLGRSLLLKSIKIVIHQVPEEPLPMEPPIVENLVPAFGYTYVQVYEGEFLIYQHPHRFYDIVTKTLREKLKNQHPEETWWGFRVDVPGMPEISALKLNSELSSVYAIPQVKGKAEIYPYAPGEKPRFKIRRLADEEPPVKTLADFGLLSSSTSSEVIEEFDEKNISKAKLDKDLLREQESRESAAFEEITNPQITESQQTVEKTPVKIVLSRSLYQDLCHQRPLSQKVEEGGFLIGKVFRDGDDRDTYLLEISNALKAKHTGASFLHLTFPGDSFVEVKRTLHQNHQGDLLLGWYHTHLFPATPNFGLSSIDDELHFSTFTKPWQVAGLINLDGNKRTLRFYVRQGKKMILCPHLVIDERY